MYADEIIVNDFLLICLTVNMSNNSVQYFSFHFVLLNTKAWHIKAEKTFYIDFVAIEILIDSFDR